MAMLKIEGRNFFIKEKLGQGAFGIVNRVEDANGKSYAIKSITCPDVKAYEKSKEEVKILQKLNHENIVRILGSCFIKETNTAVLLMEFCSQGTLNRRLNMPVDTLTQLQWMQQLSKAIVYLHGQKIVHRDLKPENILISKGNVLKVADFGLSRYFVSCTRGQVYDACNKNFISQYVNTYMGTYAGTPPWMAPEVFDGKYTEKADIFSLGIIFYAICERKSRTIKGEKYYGAFTCVCGKYIGLGAAMNYSDNKTKQPEFENTEENLKSIILGMLTFNPKNRILINDVEERICMELEAEEVEEKKKNIWAINIVVITVIIVFITLILISSCYHTIRNYSNILQDIDNTLIRNFCPSVSQFYKI